jgi:hypothetical protein
MTEPKYVTPKKRQEAVDAYALAVGRLSIAWNYLHGALGDLFALVIGGDAELVIAKWRSVKNDGVQRGKLRAAIEAESPERWRQTPTALADLLWVLERAGKLSDVRNDAVHAPVMLHIGGEIVEVNVTFQTMDEHERRLLAIVESGRKLLDEFAECQQDVSALSIFVRRAALALAEPDRREWPTLPEQILVSPKAHKDPNAESEGVIKRRG